jgi:oligopeptide transport system ATP-binding protein
MNDLLQIRDLHVFFSIWGQKIHALRGITLSLRKGEILGIVGESGCGKSVAAKAIMQLLPSHCSSIPRGEILYDGQDLLSLRETEMQKVRGKQIGMIFQDPMTSLNPTKTIGVQVMEGYRLHHPHISEREAELHAIELMQKVGIPQPKERLLAYPHMFSGGMRQRAMIALAIASEPQVLLADEPTTALDVTIQAQILDLLKKIAQEKGTSIILITHDLSVIASMCDRVAIMYAGKIVEEASVDELFSSPRHPYTRGLLHSIPRLDTPRDHPLVPIEGRPPNLSTPFTGCAFCPRCSVALRVCTREDPPFIPCAEGHRVACWQEYIS